jgi:hypothetical protein
MLSPETIKRWEHIIEDVEKTKVPIEFIKKLIIKMPGRKRQTFNIPSMLKQGLDPEEIDILIGRKLNECSDDDIVSIEFVLDIENIATIVQPEADRILKDL